MEKVACYIRVSTEEQKLHGISLDAQRDKLKEYAEAHKLIIVGWYEDEGISGRKLIRKRPELQRMLNDAQARKFDRIIFIKLDRFFRSVAEYHECMKKIEPVVWTATEEKYDLSTANGRAFVNMKLTIAELEADQTGERIKIVNDYKVKTGQAITGSHSLPLGFIVEKIDGIKRVVHDPATEDAVHDMINHFLLYQTKNKTCKHMINTHGINMTIAMLTRYLKNTMLYGAYKNNPEYCAPYVDKATYDEIQEVLKKNIKQTPTNNIYLFTGLAKCPVCGNNMTYVLGGQKVQSLRCNAGTVYRTCSYNKCRSERKVEKQLLAILDKNINVYIKSVSISDSHTEVAVKAINGRIDSIKNEMKNLNNIYRKGRISEVEYDRDYAELENQLAVLEKRVNPDEKRDLKKYEELLQSDWRNIYSALSRENKRAFWRKYVRQIVFNENGEVKDILFF